MVENKKYPPSYYRYHKLHKSITITYNKDEYDKIMECFGGTTEIKKALLDMALEKPVNIDANNELVALQEKYNKLLKINKILIEKLKDTEE